jgi:hypothetical protein
MTTLAAIVSVIFMMSYFFFFNAIVGILNILLCRLSWNIVLKIILFIIMIMTIYESVVSVLPRN